MTITRRNFLKIGAGAGAGLFLTVNIGGVQRVMAIPLPGGTLNPADIPKYLDPLVIPPAMPRTSVVGGAVDYYEIGVRQFEQFILPTAMGLKTTVWSYGSETSPGTYNYPAFTVEARANRPVRVKWVNRLVNDGGSFLPHLLPVDPTLHWANPGGGLAGRDTHPEYTATPGPYTGPVPMVPHVHGAHVGPESDGYPEAWWLPAAANIPPGFATRGTRYDTFDPATTSNGTAVFQYPNTQDATTLWYHDHTLGMTRLNVYAGPAGFWIVRKGNRDLPAGVLPGPAPSETSSPFATDVFEIPIAVQDRAFNTDGSLFYPDTREFFDGIAGPYVPDSDVPPIWNPEFFGNVMVVNGRAWPTLAVQARRYRFRLLNGCNSRFLILKITDTAPSASNPAGPATPALPIWQIGAEQGFLPAPVQLGGLLMAPAERADVIVDFSALPVGTELYLVNEGPDEPFGGGEPGGDFDIADADTTRHVMKFNVVPATGPDTSTPPAQLILPAIRPLPATTRVRRLALNEVMNDELGGPAAALLGTVDAAGWPLTQMWMEPATQVLDVGATEVWEIYNFTADAHPIHVHLVEFRVLNRQSLFTDENGETIPPATLLPGTERPPEPWETGPKDVVIAYPGEVTRIAATFDIPGRYVWHCHIVEHEDNEMMLPYLVTLNPAVDLGGGLPYGVVSAGAVTVTGTPRIEGNVAVGPGAAQSFAGSPYIGGTLFADPSSTGGRLPNGAQVVGGVVRRDLGTAIADLRAAAAAASAMQPTQTFGAITRTTTIVGTGGLNVIKADRIQLSGSARLVIRGGPTDEFVIRTGRIDLSGSASVALNGDVLPSRVLFTSTGPASGVSLTRSSRLVGSVLAPDGPVAIRDSARVVGMVFAGVSLVVAGSPALRMN
ncbi:MAG TPA: multicopper oxidase [Ilumatobacteraceae bacterium]|nr:multicopper oxidase [Ilumatobacteraceae bacterium]